MAVGYKRRSDFELSALLAFFPQLLPEKQRKCRGRRKDFFFFFFWSAVALRQHKKGQAADEPCPMYKSVKMLLPVIASLFNLTHSSGLTRLFCITHVDKPHKDEVLRWFLNDEAKTDQGADDALFTF